MKLSVLFVFSSLTVANGFVGTPPSFGPHSSSAATKSFVLMSTSTQQVSSTANGTSTTDNDNEKMDKDDKKDLISAILTDKKQLLNNILRIAASSGRGEFATRQQKETVMESILELESTVPPERDLVTSPDICGTWELVYSDTQLFRSSPFFMAGRAVCSTQEQADQYDWFCDMHRAALAISNIGAVRQVISETRMVSEFEVKAGAVPFLSDVTPFTYSGGLPFTIDGAIVSSADITPTDDNAWEIFMDTVEIKGSNVPLLRNVLDGGLKLASRDLGSFLEQNVASYTNPKPLFTTTYLTDNIRISRDQDGKVFVYSKVSDSTEPTDYSEKLADLGIAKLLEGFNDKVTKFYL